MPPVCPNGHAMGMTRGSVDMAGTLTYWSMSATALRACTWYIRHVDVFRRLTAPDADALARAMMPRRFASGQLIVSPETQPELGGLTPAGPARLLHRERDGRETTAGRPLAGAAS